MNTRNKILLGIIVIATLLRVHNIFCDVSKLPMEVSWIWERNLTSVGPLPEIGLPSGYSFILSIVDWIVFPIGYFLGFFKSMLDFDSKRLTDIQMFLFIGRLVNVIFGIATIYLVYLIGKKIKNKETGLISSLFLTFMYMHIEESRYVHYLVPLVFFIMLAFLFIVQIFTGRLKYYLLAGFIIGLGGIIKCTSFITIIPFILAHILRFNNWKDSFKKININKILLGGFFIIVGFICGYPLLFNQTFSFFDNLRLQYFCLVRDVAPDILPKTTCWIDYLPIIYRGIGSTIIIPFLCGMLYCLLKRQKKDILIISYPIVFYTCLGSLKNLTYYYVLPLFPFIALIGAYFLTSMTFSIHSQKLKKIILVAMPLILTIPPAVKILKSNLYLHVGNEKEVIKEFISQHTLNQKELLDSNQKLVDNIPIMRKISEKYFFPDFKKPIMDNYSGRTIEVSGKIIFKELKEGSIKISIRSSNYCYRYGPPDIALIDYPKAGPYAIKLPQNCGEVIIRAMIQKSRVTLIVSPDIYLKIGENDIKDVDLII